MTNNLLVLLLGEKYYAKYTNWQFLQNSEYLSTP